MLELNLEQKQGEWFEYFGSTINDKTGEIVWDEKPIKGVRVKVRNPAPLFEEQLSKRKREVEHVPNPLTRGMDRITYFKELSFEEAKAQQEESLDYAIVDFEGFTNKGKLIECTKENKILMCNNPAFDRFVGRCIRFLRANGVSQQEEEIKNSSTGSSLKTTGLGPASPSETEES